MHPNIVEPEWGDSSSWGSHWPTTTSLFTDKDGGGDWGTRIVPYSGWLPSLQWPWFSRNWHDTISSPWFWFDLCNGLKYFPLWKGDYDISRDMDQPMKWLVVVWRKMFDPEIGRSKKHILHRRGSTTPCTKPDVILYCSYVGNFRTPFDCNRMNNKGKVTTNPPFSRWPTTTWRRWQNGRWRLTERRLVGWRLR